MPWPLGIFQNKRSFCSIDNFCYVIKELATNLNLISGIYNVSDDHSVSTNEVIELMSQSLKKKIHILKLPKPFINFFIFFIKYIYKDINLENLEKLITNFEVSNSKLKNLINKPLPINAKDGLMKTFNSFISI
jgi:nucleoside-diphosphate-sugar epimerase